MFVSTWARVCSHLPTYLCCSGWFWQWWCCAGVNWSSCCPPRRLPPPLPASSLSRWHARSCGSACGSSRAWAGPGHPPPATPSRWTLTHTPLRSARSPPLRSPVEEGGHRQTYSTCKQTSRQEKRTREGRHPGTVKNVNIKMHRHTPAKSNTKERDSMLQKVISLSCRN